jgi:hypothetical protein
MIDALPRLRGRVVVLTVLVCLACTLPYWRAMFLPAISDTYLQVWLGRKYLHFATWPDLAADALYRCRATSIWITGLFDALFGSAPVLLKAQSILLHIANVALVAALGRYARIGYQISIPAALLWGFNERHHEAVMWYAALPEQLVFFFVLLTLLLWLEWWKTNNAVHYLGAMISFILALLSKESAVLACAMLALPAVYEPGNWRRALRGAIPFVALSVIYFAANHAARQNHLHWNDGTFQLGWHFIPVIFNSTARLLSIWGALALVVLFWHRRRIDWRLPATALIWIPIALSPYAFVAYQPRVPSRHVYLASLGAAILLAVALQLLASRRKLALSCLAVYLLFNTGYIWFYKHDQFLQRANVTENLIRDAKAITAREGLRPLQVRCFPLGPELATLSIHERIGIAVDQISVQYSPEKTCGETTVDLILD